MDKREFVRELQRLRMSQAGFASLLQIDRATVYRWEVIPEYAVVIVELMKRLRELEERISV